MKQFLILLLLTVAVRSLSAQTTDSPLYELRTYHCNEGKRPDLIARFQNHTTRIFEKHGMENMGYWLPVENENDLIYILSFPNKAARDAAWKGFSADDEWQAVSQASQVNGKIVDKVDSQFLTLNEDLSADIESDSGMDDVLFELRTYYCQPGKFPNLVNRFRDHTLDIFENHDMMNIAYWQTVEENGVQSKLVYILAHENMKAAKASWKAFGNDPEWKKVAEESQRDGKIVEKVESVYMKALPFSGMK